MTGVSDPKRRRNISPSAIQNAVYAGSNGGRGSRESEIANHGRPFGEPMLRRRLGRPYLMDDPGTLSRHVPGFVLDFRSPEGPYRTPTNDLLEG